MACSKFVVIAGALSAILSAQTLNTGTFLGTVTDSSGASIAGVAVQVHRTDQPLQRDAVTDGTGNFLIPQLPTGSYRIEFTKSGFQKVVRPEIDLSAGQSLRLDATLNVGAVSE